MKALFLTASVLIGACAVAQVAFTTSGTFLVPAGVTSIDVELVGAGGNGYSNGGGGGAGGGYAAGTFAVIPGTSHAITIGEGGSGVGTSISGLGILAGAGTNGSIVDNPNVGGGGNGGSGTGGTVNRTGGSGGGGFYTYFGGGGGGAAGPIGNGIPGGNTITWTGICLTPGGAAGPSGGAPGGAGGKGAGFTDVNCVAANPAGSGITYGGGGGGGNGNGSGSGMGAGGYCSITWEIPTGIHHIASTMSSTVVNNPFTDRIMVSPVFGDEHFVLCDATGRQLWSGEHIERQDLSALRAGAYFLRMEKGNYMHSFKVMKQ
ncbi:MAG: T9SS type A sorting domain-containing protein [Flavobacteriales bacterium]|nr:T9SS type A sorting domain-containing protein [Flavobacteriales bacterium]